MNACLSFCVEVPSKYVFLYSGGVQTSPQEERKEERKSALPMTAQVILKTNVLNYF